MVSQRWHYTTSISRSGSDLLPCLLNSNLPIIFEDGYQSRDFVHVKDVVQANLLTLEREEACYEVFNVGIDKTTTALQLAEMLNERLGFSEPLIVTNKYREGGICHCFADITKIQTKLGYKPKIFRRRNRGPDCLGHKLWKIKCTRLNRNWQNER